VKKKSAQPVDSAVADKPTFPEARGLDLARRACRILSDKKAEALAILDVRGRSSLSDYLALANGSSGPHLKAMRNELLTALKREGSVCYRKAGDPESGWLILDYSDVVVHLFLADVREYYALEALWPDAPRIGVEPDAPAGRNGGAGPEPPPAS